MPTLVTGATGLLGNNVVRALLDRGESVRVLVRESSDPRPIAGLDVEVVQGDLGDGERLQQACQGVEAVLHCAGWVHIGWAGLRQARAVNVEGTHRLAQAALAAGAMLVHVSSMSALGIGKENEPADEDSPRVGQVPCPYMLTKREGEEVVLQYLERGLHVLVVNPGFMLGPWDWKPSSGRMLLEVARRFTPMAPRGGCSVCDVRDVANGILAAMERGTAGRRYLLAGHNMKYLDLWRIMAQVSGSKAPRSCIGPHVSRLGGLCGDLISHVMRREPNINSAATRVSQQFHYYRSDRAVAELGYQYRPAQEAVEMAWEWFQRHGYV